VYVVGVEPSEGFLEKAKEKLGARVLLRRGSAGESPLEDRSVDVAVSGFVLNFVSDALAGLREMARVTRPGGRVAILSNGSPAMLEAAVKSAGLDLVVDEIFSVDQVRRFKTDPSVYDMVTTAWRLYPGKVSFQSSNRWDAAGAKKFGFRTVWINRSGLPDEYTDFPPDLILTSLEGLAARSL